MGNKKLLSTLLLSSLFLVACQSQKAPEETTAVETTTETTTTTVSTTVEVKPDYSLYDGIISKYATVTKNSKGDVDQSINTIAYLLRNNEIYTGIDYALYDLDKNGTDELIISFILQNGNHIPLDIYTLKDGQVIRLTSPEVKLASIGERVLLDTLVDGSLLMSTSSSAGQNIHMIQYKFDSTGTKLEQTHEWKIDRSKGEKVPEGLPESIKKDEFTYKSVYTKPVTKKEASAQKGINIVEIQNGDYSSLAGTWRNAQGLTIVFDKNGLVSEHSEIFTAKPEKDGTVLRLGVRPKGGGVGGFFILLIPAGAEAPKVNNGDGTTKPAQSDNSRDRLYAGQDYSGKPDHFLYKVD